MSSSDSSSAAYDIYFDIIVPIVSIISLIVMQPAFYKYIKRNDCKIKCLFWTESIFFISIFFTIVASVFSSLSVCRGIETEIYNVFINALSLLYVLQTMLLLWILFARLYFVFDDTTFALSSVTIKLYLVSYALFIIASIVTAIVYSNCRELYIIPIIMILLLIMFIFILIALVSLFIYKLAQVHKSVDAQNSNSTLIEVITKTSVLATFSILSTLLLIAGFIWKRSIDSPHTSALFALLTIFDTTANFWCVILNNRSFNDWYLKLCGRCNSQCIVCWNKIVEKESKDTVKMKPEVQIKQTNIVHVRDDSVQSGESNI